MNSPHGRTIILTGASRGIGYEIAECLLSKPLENNVLLIARTEAPLLKLREKYGRRAKILIGDATDPKLPMIAIEETLLSFGRIDGLIVNHGVVAPVTRIVRAELDDWRKGFDINFFSAVEFAKAAMPHISISCGSIIFTSSGAATSATSGWSFYGSSKAALNHFAMSIAHEEPDITSLAIRPGMVDTQMQEELRNEHIEILRKDGKKFLDAHKEGKLLPPHKPARVIARLAAGPPRHLSGQFLTWNCEELAAYQDKDDE